MEITDIKFRRLNQEAQLKALVSITFDHSLAVHDIKVILGKQRLFLAMPSRRLANGEYRDIVHPIGKEMRQKIEEKALAAYHAWVEEQEALLAEQESQTPGEEGTFANERTFADEGDERALDSEEEPSF